MMNYQSKTKEELIKELEELLQENNSLKALYDKDITGRKQAKQELIIANKELAFQNKEKEKRAEELRIANKELAFQNEEKSKRADELGIANKELAFQNKEKEKRAEELRIANKELAFQNEEKSKRADELGIANKELAFQNKEKEKRTAELTRSKQLLDETGRLARIGGWEIDLKKNELIWSDAVYQIHEIEPDYQPTVESAINFYAPEAIPVISEAVRRAIEEGKSYDIDLQLITAKQNRIWVRAIGQVYRVNGEIVKIGGIFQDINERKLEAAELIIANKELVFQNEEKEKRAAELILANKELAFQNEEKEKRAAELIISNKELEQFAYVASHDLQEPLRMVASFTQLLERRYKDKLDQDANDFIHYAVDGANRMQKLINDLLDYSRITSRGKDFDKVDVSQVLGQAVSNLQQLIIENTALITNDDLPELKADESQILRVFQNLIENAIKFKKKSEMPKIHISCKKKNEFYEFAVRDNGIGMDMQFHDRVFTIFQRLHSKEEYPGTGIGLSICKRIVERHGGKIWFESKENEGTTFYFTLKE
jgi:signal transduction histidine kinase